MILIGAGIFYLLFLLKNVIHLYCSCILKSFFKKRQQVNYFAIICSYKIMVFINPHFSLHTTTHSLIYTSQNTDTCICIRSLMALPHKASKHFSDSWFNLIVRSNAGKSFIRYIGLNSYISSDVKLSIISKVLQAK